MSPLTEGIIKGILSFILMGIAACLIDEIKKMD